jgi:hypothetical protein
MNSKKDIEKAVKRLVVDNGWDKARALSFLHSKYQSENRIEETAIVRKLIKRSLRHNANMMNRNNRIKSWIKTESVYHYVIAQISLT